MSADFLLFFFLFFAFSSADIFEIESVGGSALLAETYEHDRLNKDSSAAAE